MIRIFTLAGLMMTLVACAQQNPKGGDPQQPPGGYYRGYNEGPVTNDNPYELPEYRGGYTPY